MCAVCKAGTCATPQHLELRNPNGSYLGEMLQGALTSVGGGRAERPTSSGADRHGVGRTRKAGGAEGSRSLSCSAQGRSERRLSWYHRQEGTSL